MSEVNRYFMGSVEMVPASDFDRVTAERDAALGREAALLKELHEIKESMAYRGSLLGRVQSERDALQQRLTAADDRADVLEGLLRDVSGRGRVVNWELGLIDQIDDALKGFCSSCNGAGWANQGCVDLCTACAGSGMSQAKTAKADANE